MVPVYILRPTQDSALESRRVWGERALRWCSPCLQGVPPGGIAFIIPGDKWGDTISCKNQERHFCDLYVQTFYGKLL